MAGAGSQEVTSQPLCCTQGAERANWKQGEAGTPKAHPQGYASSSWPSPPKSSTDSTTDRGASVQVHEPMGTFLIHTRTATLPS